MKKSTKYSLIAAVGYVLLGLSLAPAVKMLSASVLLLIMVGFALSLSAIVTAAREEIYEQFTREVDLTQVPVLGEKNFIFQGEILLKNGKMVNVRLISGTTTPYCE